MKLPINFILIYLTGLSFLSSAQPVINNFTPKSGTVGTSVVITGLNFNTTCANNVVFFGPTKAIVTFSSATQISVTVPIGATYNYITITDLTTGLTAYSLLPFTPTFSCGGAFNSNSFEPETDFTTCGNMTSVGIGDFDGDGKTDIASNCYDDSKVTVLKNNSLAGAVAFGPNIDFLTQSSGPYGICVGDLNGDGKLDIVIGNYNSNFVTILKNTSSNGTISFAPPIMCSTNGTPIKVDIGDLNADGKPEIVTANRTNGWVSVLKNTSAGGNISFAPKIDIAAFANTCAVKIGDINGDNKPDIVVAIDWGHFTILKNNSIQDSISLAYTGLYDSGGYPYSLSLGDIDGDGKQDIVFTNSCQIESSVSIVRNTSTTSSVTFMPRISIPIGTIPNNLSLNDMNGDGKPDIIVDNTTAGAVSLLKNNSVPGTISFAPKVNITTIHPLMGLVGDIDGDNKPDIITRSPGAGTVSIFRNLVNATQMTSPGSDSICSGSNLNFQFTSNSNTIYNWYASDNPHTIGENTSIHTSDFIYDTLINSTTSVQDVVYHVTPIDTNNGCIGTTQLLHVFVFPPVGQANSINGPTSLCSGQNGITYNIPIINNATSYIWSLPNSATGSSTTNSISVNFNSPAVSGVISVSGNNVCGNGNTSMIPITIIQPPVVGPISGLSTVCVGQDSVIYTIPINADATSYIWSLPNGVYGSSTTNNIMVNFGPASINGNITAKGINSCFTASQQTILPITVLHTPIVGPISGLTSVCSGQDSVIYKVPFNSDATSYIWILPNGVTGYSITDSIKLFFGPSSMNGNIAVQGTNACYTSTTSVLSIIIIKPPDTAGIIVGESSVCQELDSVVYSIPAISNADTYFWTLPNGAIGNSNTNSILVNYGPIAMSGNISVKGINSCFVGAMTSLFVNVENKPPTPFIAQIGNILHSDATTGNQWYGQGGLISGATNQNYTFTGNGNYYDIVTLNGCISDSSNHVIITNAGIENILNRNTVNVYPNPANDMIMIETSQEADIEIINMQGQIVVQQKMLQLKTKIDIRSLSKGLYFIKLTTGEGNVVRKFVKE